MNAGLRLLSSAPLVGLCRLVTGLVLLVAALSKIGEPSVFARQIAHYDVIPIGLENVIAITLPWIELVTGLALVLGVRARSGAWLATGLMVAFTLAVAQAVARRLDIECGCFGTTDATRVGTSKLLENLALTIASLIASLRAR